MKVMVFGASGQIGDFLLPRLLARGDEIVAVSRVPRQDEAGVCWLQGDLPDKPDPTPAVDAIYCLGPLTAFAAWLRKVSLSGRPRLLAMSSMSVLSKRDSIDAGERAMVAAMAEAERELAALCEARGMAWTLLRSTLIYGNGRDRSLSPIARLAMRWHVFPLPPGRGQRQPVHADDLARALVEAAVRPGCANRILQLGGGERLPAAAMFARTRQSLPVWTMPLPLPRSALAVLARWQPVRAPMIARLDCDLVVDNAEAETLLGFRPRPFQPHW